MMILPWSHPVVLNPVLLDWESSFLTTTVIGTMYVKSKCLLFINIKQTLIIKQQQSKYSQRNVYFFVHCFQFLCWIKFCSGYFRHFEGQKEVVAITLDRRLTYTVVIVWELAWVDSTLVILDKWLSYRCGCLNKFDCNTEYIWARLKSGKL